MKSEPHLVWWARNIDDSPERVHLPRILRLPYFDDLLESMTNIVDVDLRVTAVPEQTK